MFPLPDSDSDSDSDPFPIVSAWYRNLCPSPNPNPSPAMEISHQAVVTSPNKETTASTLQRPLACVFSLIAMHIWIEELHFTFALLALQDSCLCLSFLCDDDEQDHNVNNIKCITTRVTKTTITKPSEG